MKMILRRNDKTSIFCPPAHRKQTSSSQKTKRIGLMIAGIFMATGILIIITAQ